MSDQTKSLNMLVYVNIKESCRGRIKLHKLSWSRYRFSTFVSLVHKTLYLTGQGYSLLGNLARLSTSVSTRKSLVSGQLSTNPLIKVSIHRPLLNVSFRTHFNGEILRHFSTTLDNRAKLMLVIPTKLSLCTRSMKKVTEKVAKEVAKASSEESSNLVPKVAPSAGLHSPNTSLGSGQPKLPLSKSDGDLPKAKSCGGAFLDRSFGLGSRTSGNNPLTPLGGNTQTTTQVTSANNHDMGKEVDTRDYVVFQIRNPHVLKDSHEQTQNNEIVTIPGKKTKRFIQHPEVTRTSCHIPGCNGVICQNLCGRFQEAHGVTHVTHHVPVDPQAKTKTAVGGTILSKDGKTFVKISDKDFDGASSEQFATFYPDRKSVV